MGEGEYGTAPLAHSRPHDLRSAEATEADARCSHGQRAGDGLALVSHRALGQRQAKLQQLREGVGDCRLDAHDGGGAEVGELAVQLHHWRLEHGLPWNHAPPVRLRQAQKVRWVSPAPL